MTTSHREKVYAAAYALVEATPEAVWVRRNFPNTLDIADFPALVMFDGGAEYEEMSPIQRNYIARFDVVLAVRSETDDLLGPAINSLRASLLDTMRADPTLNGLVSLVQHTSDSDPELPIESGRPPEMQMTMSFQVEGVEHLDPYLP